MWYTKSIEEVARELRTNLKIGLREKDVQEREKQFGKNKIREAKKESLIVKFIKQFNDFIFFIILGIIISCIFDIFRTLRKVQKKNSIYVVMIQDIIFFIIIFNYFF